MILHAINTMHDDYCHNDFIFPLPLLILREFVGKIKKLI